MRASSVLSWAIAALSYLPGSLAIPKPKSPWVQQHGHPWGKSPFDRRGAAVAGENFIPTTAPHPNIFQELTTSEAITVTEFLHKQVELNLTAAENATR
jgi:hypothetical protein